MLLSKCKMLVKVERPYNRYDVILIDGLGESEFSDVLKWSSDYLSTENHHALYLDHGEFEQITVTHNSDMMLVMTHIYQNRIIKMKVSKHPTDFITVFLKALRQHINVENLIFKK